MGLGNASDVVNVGSLGHRDDADHAAFLGRVGIVLAIRWLLRQGREPRSDSALEILRQRYARGDLTKDDFDRMKKELQ
jgi:hypothetical protein